jgi:phenylacetate-CoA ligase
MDRITGRTDDMLIIRGVNVFPTQIEELILGERRLAPHYYLVLTRETHLDALTINVELQPESVTSTQVYEETSRAFAQRVKAYIGITAQVVVNAPGTIERSLGKAKRVIDKRKLTS